jgi:hypothetical protein
MSIRFENVFILVLKKKLFNQALVVNFLPFIWEEFFLLIFYITDTKSKRLNTNNYVINIELSYNRSDL